MRLGGGGAGGDIVNLHAGSSTYKQMATPCSFNIMHVHISCIPAIKHEKHRKQKMSRFNKFM